MKRVRSVSKSVLDQFRNRPCPMDSLGYVVYKRTYARMIDENRTEEWFDTVKRCVEGMLKIGVPYTQEDADTMFAYMFELKCLPAGRGLWQLGTKLVDRIGGDSLNNCWYVSVDDPIETLSFAMNELMLGGGVGFGISSRYYRPPKVIRPYPKIVEVDSFDVDFVVPDNREGWCELLRRVLRAWLVTGRGFTFSLKGLRKAGEPIRSFGGKASGPDALRTGIANIQAVLEKRAGGLLRKIDVMDLANIIGSIVVAGNVRRSAEICIGDLSDRDFLTAKWFRTREVPFWRAMSNNSVYCSDPEELAASELFWEGYAGVGEPYGIVNLESIRRYGRVGESCLDQDIEGVNPCAEATLSSYEPCNLAEIFLPNIKSEEEFRTAVRLLYLYQKTLTSLPYVHPRTEDVVRENRRIGMGITGWLSRHRWREKHLRAMYIYLRELDHEFSAKHNLPASIRLTTVKPSGTLSLLAGCTPGVHPAFAPYMIRRVRFGANDPMLDWLRDQGFTVQPDIGLDGKPIESTMVVDFPIRMRARRYARQVSAVDQLREQMKLQRSWSDQAVSCTVYYRPEEVDDLRRFILDNLDSIKTTSCLRKEDHGFPLPPLEEIDASTYRKLARRIHRSSSGRKVVSTSDPVSMCEGGSCPVR